MDKLSLYIPKKTYIHQKVDPITKLIYFIAAIVVSFTIPTLFGAICFLGAQLLLVIWAREFKRATVLIVGVLLLLLSIIIIQGMFHPSNETLVWEMGPIHFYKEGLLRAFTITLRMINIILAASLLILTTSPSHLMEACMRRGLPAKIGYIIVSIFQVIPMMLQSASTIQEAQESRGMNVRGSLWVRIKAFIPLLVPLILSSFVSIRDRAMALEVRGFSATKKRSFLNEEVILPGMYLIRTLFLLLMIAIIIWRLVL